MAIQMTRAEYEAKYGSSPTPQGVQNTPVSATPKIKMTRAEYQNKYGQLPTNTVSKSPVNIEQQKQERIAQGLPVSVREDRVEPTLGGQIVRAPLKLASTIASTVVPAGRAIAGEEDVYRPIKSDYLGDVYSPGGKAIRQIDQGTFIDPNKSVGQNVGRAIGQAAKGTLGVAGTGAEAASYAVGGGALPNLGKQALLKFAGTEALAGGLGAFGASTQNAVDNAATVKEGLGNIAKDTAIGAGIGVLGGGLIGGASKLPSAIRKITPQSETIMNRVARLTPSDAKNFERLAGKSHGKYLEETGNFGRPDEIVNNEVAKFSQSVKDVDNALAQLPGTYKPKEVIDVITPLEDRLIRVQSPEAERVVQLKNKLNTTGLDMSEINEIKRLYEKNVKLAYNKLNNADAVELATNLDNRLREWQVKQADTLGFDNIREMNKQTQLSRFIADKLGGQLIGKSGLDGMNLTDWIMVSGGDPTAVGGLITKKFFSDPGIQAKIANYLSKAEKSLPIKPNLGETKLLRLEAPKGSTISSKGSGSTIPVAPKGANMEFTGQVGGIIPEKPSLQLLKGKLEKKASMPKLSTKLATKSKNLSTDKGIITTAIENLKNPATRQKGSITIPGLKSKVVQGESYINDTTKSLLEEAKKYKSAEEFFKNIFPNYAKQPNNPLYHGTSANIKNGKLTFGAGNGVKKGGQSGGHFLSDSKKISEVFAGNGKVYIIDPAYKKNILDLTSKRGIKEIENYIGNTYKTYDGEKMIFTRDDFDIMFPNGKTDFASISQYPELIEQITRKRGYRGIAFDEYAGGETGKTYQILHSDNIPIIEQKKISDSELAKLIKEKTEIEPKATDLRLEEYGRNQDGYLTDNQIDELDYLEKRVKEIDNILISSDYKSQLEDIWKKANKK